jgi:hypothetical protein
MFGTTFELLSICFCLLRAFDTLPDPSSCYSYLFLIKELSSLMRDPDELCLSCLKTKVLGWRALVELGNALPDPAAIVIPLGEKSASPDT